MHRVGGLAFGFAANVGVHVGGNCIASVPELPRDDVERYALRQRDRCRRVSQRVELQLAEPRLGRELPPSLVQVVGVDRCADLRREHEAGVLPARSGCDSFEPLCLSASPQSLNAYCRQRNDAVTSFGLWRVHNEAVTGYAAQCPGAVAGSFANGLQTSASRESRPGRRRLAAAGPPTLRPSPTLAH